MEKKYELLKNDFVEVDNKKLYRIKALKDFSNVKKGDLGGYIQSEANLSHEGDCWVFENAWVYGNARVSENARVFENAWVYGNARVSENAHVYGDACVYGNACVSGNAWIKYGSLKIPIKTFKEKEYIASSLNVCPIKNKYFLFKKVNKIDEKYFSIYDKKFEYKKEELTEIKNFDTNILTACSSGLHFSTPAYWKEGNCLIACEIDVKDIITCQEGKIRASKCKFVEEIYCE